MRRLFVGGCVSLLWVASACSDDSGGDDGSGGSSPTRGGNAGALSGGKPQGGGNGGNSGGRGPSGGQSQGGNSGGAAPTGGNATGAAPNQGGKAGVDAGGVGGQAGAGAGGEGNSSGLGGGGTHGGGAGNGGIAGDGSGGAELGGAGNGGVGGDASGGTTGGDAGGDAGGATAGSAGAGGAVPETACSAGNFRGSSCYTETNGAKPFGSLVCATDGTIDPSQCVVADGRDVLVNCHFTAGTYMISKQIFVDGSTSDFAQLSPTDLAALIAAVSALQSSSAGYEHYVGPNTHSIPHRGDLAIGGSVPLVDSLVDTGAGVRETYRHNDPAAAVVRKYTCGDLVELL